MELGGLTTTLTHFIGVFQSGYGRLQPAINGLLASLAAIEIVLLGFWMALGGSDNLAAVIRKLLFLGFWLWFTTSFQSNASAFVHSLVKAGLTAGGNPGAEALLLDPSQIAGMGLQATAPLAESLQGITYHLGDMLVFGLSYIVIMLTFVLMAIQVFLSVLEYYLLVTLVAILVPFGILPQTKFLAEKAIGAVVGAGVKLMVLGLLMAVLGPLLSQIRFSGSDIKLNELWIVLGTCLCYAYLVWHVPGTIAGALAGSPSLSAASVAQNASGALMGAAGAAGVAVAATRTAAGAATGTVGAGARALGTAAGGWSRTSSATEKAGGTASFGSKALGAGRALGQAALGAAGGLARRVTSPVADSFRAGARDALNRNDAAGSASPPGSAGPSPISATAGDLGAGTASASPPPWAAAAKSALQQPLSGGEHATPSS
jgi:type IV secretion system protein TrbL